MMWYNFIKGYGFQNVYKGGQITGFQFKIHLPYYRGLWASQAFQRFGVNVDGVDYAMDKVSIKLGDRVFPFSQINGAYDVFWYYGEPATIIVDKPGGLTAGVHKVTCGIHYSRSYSTEPKDASKTELFVPPSAEQVAEGYGGFSGEWWEDTQDMVLVI
ncbi:MAG: hypothetical protein JXB24_15655 [Bacteroidales bacterium]|nr:hypothetical protein [Bacteroidales bacterium]